MEAGPRNLHVRARVCTPGLYGRDVYPTCVRAVALAMRSCSVVVLARARLPSSLRAVAAESWRALQFLGCLSLA